MKSKFITANLLLLSLINIFTPSFSHAMENSDFNLDLDQPSEQTEENLTTKTPINITAKVIEGPGYKAILSYDSEIKPVPFSSSNSTPLLNFGDIKPGEPLIRSNIISVSPGTAPGFQTVGYINHTLRATNKAEIPNTSCDNGNCTNILSDIWTLPLTYGYGYNCENISGNACNMANKEMYKRFSSQELKEDPSTILYALGNKKSSVEFSHKINIPGNQSLVGYKNTLFIISSPLL